MKHKRSYVALFFPMLFLLGAVILSQLWELGREEKKHRQCWEICVQSPDGEISEELLQKLQEFPGLEHMQALLRTEVRVTIGKYHSTVMLQGMDFSQPKLEILQSAGKKQMGEVPLLVAGERFFAELSDENEKTITQRQGELLRQNLKELKAEIKPAQAENTGETGEFLALVKADGLYMEETQMRQWLKRQGISPGISAVSMEVRGEEQKIKNTLETAGFIIEMRKKHTPPIIPLMVQSPSWCNPPHGVLPSWCTPHIFPLMV